jgi:signal transduction histidine kinase
VELIRSDADWRIRVTDRGRGIPVEEQSRVFTPFFRATNTGKTPGTGLGLKITHRAVTLQGGVVEFTSAVDVGTTFTIIFPLDDSAQPPAV